MSLEAMTEEAQRLASYRMELAAHLAQLRRRRQDVDREVMPMIRHFAQLAADSKTKLIAAVGAESQLFEKPRSQSVSGVRFGMVKQKGKVVIENEPVTIKRIKNLLPEEQAELLITPRSRSTNPLSRISQPPTSSALASPSRTTRRWLS